MTFISRTGALNLITDVPGLRVGNADDEQLRSGVTVILCEQAATAAAAIHGGAPGSRETDLLKPDALVEQIDALVFSGGSAFGLDAASGVMAELAQQGRGFAVGTQRVPIVPSAILFDLLNGGDKNWGTEPPYRELGRQALQACLTAQDYTFQLGNAGAGMGATAAKLKGGLGSASVVVSDTASTTNYCIGALAAVNAFGSAVMPGGPLFWAWPFERAAELGSQQRLLSYQQVMSDALEYSFGRTDDSSHTGANTTLCAVATDAPLTKAQTARLALMAQNGLAHALRPVYTPFDGDSVFALTTRPPDTSIGPNTLACLGMHAADCVARAIARALFEASSIPRWPAYRDVYREFF